MTNTSLTPYEQELEKDLLENGFIDNKITKQEFEKHKIYLSEARLIDKIAIAKAKPVVKSLSIRRDLDEKISHFAKQNNLSYTELTNILLENSLEILSRV